MSDANLSGDDDLEALRQVQRFREQQARIPASERKPVTSPGKYSFPLGMDDEGHFFPNEPRTPDGTPDGTPVAPARTPGGDRGGPGEALRGRR